VNFNLPREAVRRSNCVNNLMQIGIALQNYHDTYKSFPPAYFADADGTPIHSWRVMLLPFFESDEMKRTYKQYDMSEPWNGPHNRRLASQIPYVYRCPSSQAPHDDTSYVAIVGDETGWPTSRPINVREFSDGLSNTIAIVEVANAGIHWMEPRDLTLEQASVGIGPSETKEHIWSPHRDGANCLFFDSSVHFLSNEISPTLLRALLTANGGEVAEPPSE
jgi:prepilin-type processing-associated H-X9-DG protein